MNIIKERSYTTIRDSFASLVDSYIKKYDESDFMSIFPPLSVFKTEELINALSDRSNYELLEEGKGIIIEYANSLKHNGGIFFPVDDIYRMLSKDYFFEKSLEFVKHRKMYYYLLKIAFFVGYISSVERKEKLYISSFNEIESEKNDNIYYRGQIDSSWRISPSILRDFNKNVVLDDNYYFRLLSKTGLEAKYNELIRTDKTWEKYSKYAFMQHSLSFSPFIDFTKEKEIATSFALSNPSQINVLESKDSAVFSIKVDSKFKIDDKIAAYHFLHDDFYIDVINSDYFVLGKNYLLRGVDNNGKSFEKSICITSISKLLARLRPSFRLFDIPVNDRMKYQKGVFICFYDCIAIKNRICYELNRDIGLHESIIRTRDKKDILKGIYNHRKYDQEHLLNPYLFFTEYYF